jgi:hypothetical protein
VIIKPGGWRHLARFWPAHSNHRLPGGLPPRWWVASGLCGSAIVYACWGDWPAALSLTVIAAAVPGAWSRWRAAVAETRAVLARSRPPRVPAVPARRAGAAPPWDTAPVPVLEDVREAGMYRLDGPTFFERHGHRPDEPCTVRCPGNPFRC